MKTNGLAATLGRCALCEAISVEVYFAFGTKLAQLESGGEPTTLAEALERYKTAISSRKAHPSQDCQRISHWLRQPLAHRYLTNLKGADFAQYRDMRRALGRAENTIRLALALVSHLFEIARKEWGMESLLAIVPRVLLPTSHPTGPWSGSLAQVLRSNIARRFSHRRVLLCELSAPT